MAAIGSERKSAGDGELERVGNLLPLLAAEHRLEGAVRRVLRRREDQLALSKLRIALREDRLDALDGRHVVPELGDVGLHLGVVDEVHPCLSRGGIRRANRDLHARRPEHAALLGHHEPDDALSLMSSMYLTSTPVACSNWATVPVLPVSMYKGHWEIVSSPFTGPGP